MKPERQERGHRTKKQFDHSDGLFQSLVDNALEFLETASVEIKRSPKQSLLNFAAGLELFLKARLLREHWALILEKPETAKREKFLRGDFKSVSPIDAINRLKDIVGQTITDYEKKAFQDLIEHRNKVIHFFNPSYTSEKQEAIRRVITEQLHAWFYLHRLLTVRWETEFADFASKILRIDHRLKNNSAYLEGKFLALKPEIEADERKGKVFAKCGGCSFKASRLDELGAPLYQYECLVCGSVKRFLMIPCPHCHQAVIVEDEGQGECECGRKTSLGDLIKMYGGYRDPHEGPTAIYCSECCSDAVIAHQDGYLCLSCLCQFEETSQCDWCSSEIAGFDSETSYFEGCILCDGKGYKD